MSRRGYHEYRHLSAVIFDHIRRSKGEFTLSLLIPWLDKRDEVARNSQQMSLEDGRKIRLVDLTLKKMIKDDIIQPVPTAQRRFEVSPRCKLEDREDLEFYTSVREQNKGFQWMTQIFQMKTPTSESLTTISALEEYLTDETQRTHATSSSKIANFSNGKNTATPLTQAERPEAAPLTYPSSLIDHSKTASRIEDKRHRLPSTGSDTTGGPSSPLPSVATPSVNKLPHLSPSTATERVRTPDRMGQPLSVNRPMDGPIPPAVLDRKGEDTREYLRTTLETPDEPNDEQTASVTGAGNAPTQYPTPSAVAGSKAPTSKKQSMMAPGPSLQDLLSPVEEDTSHDIPDVPQFITQGLARLRERFPDDEFEPSFEVDIWLIKCHDCKDGIYRPSYAQKNLANFETHLKNRQHTENVAAKLSTLRKQATVTPDVISRTEKAGHFMPYPAPISASERPTFPTERQFSAMSARSESVTPLSGSTPVISSVTPSYQKDSSPAQSLTVPLGQSSSLKRSTPTKTPRSESQERGHKFKRSRLTPDEGLLDRVLRQNEELIARVESLELLNQSLVETARKRDDEINTQLQTLQTFDRTFVENDAVSRQRIDALEEVAQDNWARYSSRHDKEIEALKKSISTMARSPSEQSNHQIDEMAKSIPIVARASHQHDIQIERVESKVAEMEQNLKQLQELSPVQNKRLEAASKMEQELRERIMMVQKLALRQADVLKDVKREREEMENRFARLEDLMATQTTRKNEWNEAFRQVIDQNSDAILQCQEDSQHIMQRIEALEKEREEQNVAIANLEAQIPSDKIDESSKHQRTSPRKGGRRVN